MPDPKKKATTKPRKSAVSPMDSRESQILGDDLAKAVARKKMTMEQAQAKQAARDKKKRKTKKVQYTSGKGSGKAGGPKSHTKAKKAKFKRGRDGNLTAY